MSSAGQTPDDGQTNPSQNAPQQKRQRVLACVLCQQRKIKCNRRFPCANCIKAGTPCIPATLTPRKRRFPERELLDRVRKYEEMLRQNNIKFDSLWKDNGAASTSPSAEGGDESDEDEDHDHPSEQRRALGTNKAEQRVEIKDFWALIDQGFQGQRDDGEIMAGEQIKKAIQSALDVLYVDEDRLLLGPRQRSLVLSTLHPAPAQILRLWQIYLDNVNPLLKVTHRPSLQGRIITAASDTACMTPTLEALMFSIYCISIQSLAPDDVQTAFGSSKEHLLTAYNFACEQALMNCNYLKSRDRDCLTAFFFYLLSIQQKTDPRSVSSMLGVAVRMAQRMGLHNETKNRTHGIFEAEMRRRLWWALILFDSRMSELSDHKATMLSPEWDCQTPVNVHDADLWEDMVKAPVPEKKPTDALFAVLRSEVANFVRRRTFFLDYNMPALRPLAVDATSEGELLSDYIKAIEQKYFDLCNSENPLHFMTIWTARTFLSKWQLVEHYSRHTATTQTVAQRDMALSYALMMLECDTKINTSPLSRGFIWYMDMYFPFPAYLYIVRDIKNRPVCDQADRAWDVMSANYDRRVSLLRGRPPFIEMFASVILPAWRARESQFRAFGYPTPEPPKIVTEMYNMLNDPLFGMSPQSNQAAAIPPQNVSCGNMDMQGLQDSLAPPNRQPQEWVFGSGSHLGLGNIEHNPFDDFSAFVPSPPDMTGSSEAAWSNADWATAARQPWFNN